MGRGKQIDPRDRRVWRLLRRLLPREFRDRRSDSVLETHVALSGGPGNARGVVFWGRVAWDVMTTAVRVRMDGNTRGRREQRGVTVGVGDAVVSSVSMAVRSLRRSPFFAGAVVLILALGIASNVTLFRVVDRLLLSPPEHIRAANQVKRLYVLGRWPFTGELEYTDVLSYPDYLGLKDASGFSAFAGYTARPLTLSVDGRGERVDAELATASYFELLGVVPAAGRFYDASEDSFDSRARTAVLGWSFWQRRFGGDRSVLGRELSIGKAVYTVVGIAPHGFTGVDIDPVDVWLPLNAALAVEHKGTAFAGEGRWFVMSGVVRVAGDVAPAEDAATAMIHAVRAKLPQEDPDERVVLASVIRARGPNASRESRVAGVLGILTALVLLITCANVGNLYLARVLARRRELAVQVALGVSRRRLFGQLIAEVMLIALAAGAIAWWAGTVAAGAMFGLLVPEATLPMSDGARVFTLTVVLALVTTLLTGVLPAMRAMRVDVMEALRRGTATRRVLLLRRGLLMLQTALSVVLLAGAGLFIRSLQRAQSVDLGVDPATMMADIELPGGVSTGLELADAIRRALPGIRESGLVDAAAASSIAPFSGWWGMGVKLPDGTELKTTGSEGPYVYGVTGAYFATLGLPVVHGRALTDDDDRPGAAPVVVVNQRMADRLWPGENPIGHCVLTESRNNAVCRTVVGVAHDYLPSIGADRAPALCYVPTHHPGLTYSPASTILIRTRPGVTRGMMRDLVASAMPEARLVTVSTIADRLAPSLRSWKMGAFLLSIVGVLALIITAAGLYSMLTFDAMHRRRELGIRAALGASPLHLLHSSIAASLTAVGLGIGAGIAVSLAAGRAVDALLFRVSSRDPAVYVTVCVTLLAAGLLAGVRPVRRVTRTNPAVPLREE